MNAPVHMLRRSIKVWLFAGIIVAAMLAVTSDRTPATAATTELGPTLWPTGTSAPAWVTNVALLKGGHTQAPLNACWNGTGTAPTIDPATSCVYVWAKNVDATSTGAAASQVEITYDSTKIHVAALTGSITWLNSTGRGTLCPPAIIEEDPVTGSGHAAVSCNTLGATAPAPKCPSHCSGLLATLQIESAPSAPAGQTAFTIDFSGGTLGGSYLLDTTCTDHCGQQMPATIHSMSARIVKCANLIDDTNHMILVNDIVYMVNRYRTHGDNFGNPPQPASPNWDQRADLDANNQLLVNDITFAVNQYRKSCLP